MQSFERALQLDPDFVEVRDVDLKFARDIDERDDKIPIANLDFSKLIRRCE